MTDANRRPQPQPDRVSSQPASPAPMSTRPAARPSPVVVPPTVPGKTTWSLAPW